MEVDKSYLTTTSEIIRPYKELFDPIEDIMPINKDLYLFQ
jgi:hypothetical protein